MYEKITNYLNLNKTDIMFIFILLMLSVLTRFLLLGGRAIHHDESLHAYYSWSYANGYGFVHNPLMHGPLIFHINAFLFFLFGDSNYILRIVPAIAGCLLILSPLLFIKIIGKKSAIFSSTLILISPTILYFSRFARNDILIALVTILIVYSLFSYLYSTTKNKYLYLASFFISLGFCIKETQYITILFLGLFSLFFSNLNPIRIVRDSIYSKKWLDIFILLFSLTLPLAAPLLGIAGNFFGLTMISGVSSAKIGMPIGSISIYLAIISTALMFILSFAFGFYWFGKKWVSYFSLFWLTYVLLFSSLGTNPQGIFTGIWQSLGYWIAQQQVARGSQPWYYFFIVIFSYEFSLIIILISSIIIIRAKFNIFRIFLISWFIANLIFYGIASEKMPWLTVNIIIPLLLYSGIILADLYNNFRKITIREKVKYSSFILVLIFIFILLFSSKTLSMLSFSFVLAWILLLIFFIQIKKFNLMKFSLNNFFQTFISMIIIVSLLITIKNSLNSSFYNSDIPDEIIVYTQTSPQVHQLVEEIKEFNLQKGSMSLAIDTSGGYQWPWAWYLRDFEVNYFDSTKKEILKEIDFYKYDFIIINSGNFLEFNSTITDSSLYQDIDQLPFRMWFPENYRYLSFGDFYKYISNQDNLIYLLRHVVFNDFEGNIGSVDITLIRPNQK